MRSRWSSAAVSFGALALAIVGAICTLPGAHGSFLPAPKPRKFSAGDSLTVEANSFVSYGGDQRQPEYYALPFCKPEGGVQKREQGGWSAQRDLLSLKRVYNTPYVFHINERERTVNACPDGSAGPLTAEQAQVMKEMIDHRYHTQLELDNLPITTDDLTMVPMPHACMLKSTSVRPGFKLGAKDSEGDYYIYNHLMFNVLLHKSNQPAVPQEEAQWMVVGFEVVPCSIKREQGDDVQQVMCPSWDDTANPEPQKVYEGADIIYTYDVYYTEYKSYSAKKVTWQKVTWQSRWAWYTQLPDMAEKLRHGVVGVSLLVAVVLGVAVAAACRQVMHSNSSAAEQVTSSEESTEQLSGWRAIKDEVFRTTAEPELLSVLFGAGAHMLCTAVGALVLFRVGAFSPERRDCWLALSVATYLLLSATAGYFSVLLWRHLQRGSEHSSSDVVVAVKAALLFPGLTLAVLALQTVLRLAAEAFLHMPTPPLSSIHFWDNFGLFFLPTFLWFNVSVFGGFCAMCAPLRVWPNSTNPRPTTRQPPPASLPFKLCQWVGFVAAVLLPFSCVYLEAFHATSSFWQGYLHNVSGITFVAMGVSGLLTAELSILCTYMQLRAEGHHWWWPSFTRGASVAAAFCLCVCMQLLYSMIDGWAFGAGFDDEYSGSTPSMQALTAVLFGCYMLLAGCVVAVSFGAVSFLASLVFVCFVYKATAVEAAAAGKDGDAGEATEDART